MDVPPRTERLTELVWQIQEGVEVSALRLATARQDRHSYPLECVQRMAEMALYLQATGQLEQYLAWRDLQPEFWQ